MLQEKKYRGHVELPNATVVELQNDDPTIVKDTVQSILKGGCRFEPVREPANAFVIYHPTFEGGKTPLGWIAPSINQPMSNSEFLERHGLPKAA